MSKSKTVWVCQSCGAQEPKWSGWCPSCGTREPLVEEHSAESGGAPAAGHRYAMAGGDELRPAVRGHRDQPARAAVDGHQRVRSCARWRRRAGVACVARRRAGHRQVHAAAAGGGEHGAHHRSRALQLGRGVRTPGEGARRAPRGGRRAALPSCRDLPRAHSRGGRAHQTGARHRRLHPDGVFPEIPVGARQHRPGPRSGDAAPVRRQGTECADVPRRPRHEGREPRRAEGARAHRRHGPLFRGRAPSLAPRRSRREEPVRCGERARGVRDDGRRAAPGAEPIEVVSRRAAVERRRLRGALLGRRIASDSGRSAGARQHEQLRHRPADGQRHRPAAVVAAAGRPRKARGAPSRRRRCVRQHRGRHDGGRAGVGSRRSGRDCVERSGPRHSGDDRHVRRGRARRRNPRHHAGDPPRPRGRADGIPPTASCRTPTSTPPTARVRRGGAAASLSASARSAKRSTNSSGGDIVLSRWLGLLSRASCLPWPWPTRRRCCSRFPFGMAANVLFALVLAGLAIVFESRLREAATTRIIGALIGCVIGLFIARAIDAGLFWADLGDHRVEFLDTLRPARVAVSRPRGRRQAGRVARTGEACRPVPGGRPGAPLQDSRHQRHHRRPHRGRLRDRLRRRHARHSAVRAEGAPARGRFGRLAEAQPRPARPRHPAEDPEDVRRRGHHLGHGFSRRPRGRSEADRAGADACRARS